MDRRPLSRSDKSLGLLGQLTYTALFNTVIALFLWSVGFGKGFGTTFVFSQCIGITICLSVSGALRLLPPRMHPMVAVAAAVVAGAVAGTLLAVFLTGTEMLTRPQFGLFLKVVAFSIGFGAVIVHFFLSRERIAEARSALQEERLRTITAERRAVEARLKVLQAQVEPHFLFNTLANVLSLMDAAPERAKAMLRCLTRFLRASLGRTREGQTTLGEELEMVRDYLEIFRIRLGDRLRYSVCAPDEVLTSAFPPMLLQPLVENAIRHGIEPSAAGGEVRVRGELADGRLRLVVEDTGPGFRGQRNGGTGLRNVRERLRVLHGDRGRLSVETNQPSGVRAIVEIPRG